MKKNNLPDKRHIARMIVVQRLFERDFNTKDILKPAEQEFTNNEITEILNDISSDEGINIKYDKTLANKLLHGVISTYKKSDAVIEKADIKQSHVQDYLKESQERFDIIFADPPFDQIVIEHIKDAASLLKPQGLLIFRHPSKFKSPSNLNSAERILQKKYGKSTISFYYLN